MKYKRLLVNDNSRKEAIIRCLKYLEEKASISHTGNVSFPLEVQTIYIEEILNAYLPLNEIIPEKARRKIIFTSITRWLRYKRSSSANAKLQSFLLALETETRIAEKGKSNYSVLMFLNIDKDSLNGIHELEILGGRLSVISWQEVFSFNIDNVWQEIHLFDKGNAILINDIDTMQQYPDLHKFTPFLFETYTYGIESALELAQNRIDLFRCIINIHSVLDVFILHRTRPKALSVIPPSPVYISFNKEQKFVTFSTTIEKFDYKSHRIKKEQKESITFLLDQLKIYHGKNSTWEHIRNILLIYQKALDTSNNEAAFLTIWQTLENSISFDASNEIGNNLKNKNIQSRIKVFIDLQPMEKDILDIIIDRRNRLVHSSKYLEDGDKMLSSLKNLTDKLLRSLIYYANKFPDKHELSEYVELYSLGNADLQRKEVVISKVKEMRNQKVKSS